MISTGGDEVILHVYDPESHRVTCSMTRVWSDLSIGIPAFTLGSVEVIKASVIMLLVPLIHIRATSSTVIQKKTKSHAHMYYLFRLVDLDKLHN